MMIFIYRYSYYYIFIYLSIFFYIRHLNEIFKMKKKRNIYIYYLLTLFDVVILMQILTSFNLNFGHLWL